MEVTIHTPILLVGALDRSIEFYTDVLGFPLISQRSQAAALQINQADRSQILLLRESPNRQAVHPGRGSIGVRVLGFEVTSVEELDEIAEKLTVRNAYLGRRRTATWESVLGVDPDQCEIAVSAGSTGRPIQITDVSDLDEMIEAVAQ